jgi:hypothetical protein
MKLQLSFPFVNFKQRSTITASTMTETEVLTIVRRELGNNAYTFDRDAHKFSESRPVAIKRFYVGTGQECYGNGDTWESALEAALKMAGKAAVR